MKKLSAAILALIICLSFSGCNLKIPSIGQTSPFNRTEPVTEKLDTDVSELDGQYKVSYLIYSHPLFSYVENQTNAPQYLISGGDLSTALHERGVEIAYNFKRLANLYEVDLKKEKIEDLFKSKAESSDGSEVDIDYSSGLGWMIDYDLKYVTSNAEFAFKADFIDLTGAKKSDTNDAFVYFIRLKNGEDYLCRGFYGSDEKPFIRWIQKLDRLDTVDAPRIRGSYSHGDPNDGGVLLILKPYDNTFFMLANGHDVTGSYEFIDDGVGLSITVDTYSARKHSLPMLATYIFTCANEYDDKYELYTPDPDAKSTVLFFNAEYSTNNTIFGILNDMDILVYDFNDKNGDANYDYAFLDGSLFDLDGDGEDEFCLLFTGPTPEGGDTFAFNVFKNGERIISNYFPIDFKYLFFVRLADGSVVLRSVYSDDTHDDFEISLSDSGYVRLMSTDKMQIYYGVNWDYS